MTFELVDPRGTTSAATATPLAVRRGTAGDLRVGFLINEVSRKTGPDFTAYSFVIETLLRERFGPLTVHRDAKPVLSRPADRAMLERYRDCRGVVSGLAK
jgi:hypothetical protein